MTNPFEHFAKLGYPRLVPVIPPDAPISERSTLFKRIGTKQDARGKTPGVKGSDGNWFSFDWVPHEADERDYRRWHVMEAGVGVKTGHGLIAIDADTLNEDYARTIKTIVDEHVGATPIRIGQYPKAIYLARTTEPTRYQRIDFGPDMAEPGEPPHFERVEILSDGRFFVAEGIHPKTKKPYRWAKHVVPFDELPILEPHEVTAFMEALRSALPAASKVIKEGGTKDYDQESLRGDPAIVRSAVEATPNTSDIFPTRESYRDYGYAIKAAVEDDQDAFHLFADWCARWQDGHNDPEIVAADWARMQPPFRRGASWLYDLADKHSINGAFSIATIYLKDESATEIPSEIVAHSKKFIFENFNDIVACDLETAPALIDELLDQGAMSIMYGDSNTGKTFVAMDLAFHVAAGLHYAGLETAQGTVVYVAAEGGNGARKRLAALKRKYPQATPDFLLLASPVDLRRPDADTVPLAEAIRALNVSVALLVIDTVSRAMAGGDENSSVDMGALVKHFDVLRKACRPAHLMGIHHTGKDRAKGARGHSLLRAATDTEIEVSAGENGSAGVIQVTKQRDMDGSWSSGFRLKVWELGLKPNGRAITSCTVDLIGVSEARALAVRPTDREREALAALRVLADETGAGEFLTAEIAGMLTDDTSKAGVEAVRKTLDRMSVKGLIQKAGRMKWALCGQNGQTGSAVRNRNGQNPLSVSRIQHCMEKLNGQKRTETDSGIFS